MTTGRISFWFIDNIFYWSLDNNWSLNTFVWNKVSRPFLQAFSSLFSCVLFALGSTLIQNPSSGIYIRKLLFYSFLASHFRTDWGLLPKETSNWTRVLSLCTMGRPSFVYKRSIVRVRRLIWSMGRTNIPRYIQPLGLVETPLCWSQENKRSGFLLVVALLFILCWFRPLIFKQKSRAQAATVFKRYTVPWVQVYCIH